MLKYTLLALLAQHPRHGYDLKTEYDQALGSITLPVNVGQIYSTLQRLEQSGWVTSEHTGSHRRDRTIYTLTEGGRRALDQWLDEPVEPGGREYFFVKLVADQLTGGERTTKMIRQQRHQYLQWLSDLSKVKARLPDGGLALPGLLLSHAIRHTKADLEWLDECEALLTRN
jgi:DNA-binding PadR family transcriptional regulator